MLGSKLEVVCRLSFQIKLCSGQRIDGGCSAGGYGKVDTPNVGLVIEVSRIWFNEGKIECLSCMNNSEHYLVCTESNKEFEVHCHDSAQKLSIRCPQGVDLTYKINDESTVAISRALLRPVRKAIRFSIRIIELSGRTNRLQVPCVGIRIPKSVDVAGTKKRRPGLEPTSHAAIALSTDS